MFILLKSPLLPSPLWTGQAFGCPHSHPNNPKARVLGVGVRAGAGVAPSHPILDQRPTMAAGLGFEGLPSLPATSVVLEGGEPHAPTMMKCGPWPVGSRLTRFYDRWRDFTSDPWILQIVREGYRLQFRDHPPPTLSRGPLLTPLRGASKGPLLEAIKTLHAKRAVVRVFDFQGIPGFYSRYSSRKTRMALFGPC